MLALKCVVYFEFCFIQKQKDVPDWWFKMYAFFGVSKTITNYALLVRNLPMQGWTFMHSFINEK